MQESATNKEQEEKSGSTSSTEKTFKLESGNHKLELEELTSNTPFGDKLRQENGITEKPKAKCIEHRIEGTPFQMVETDEGEYFVGMKPYVLTKRRETAELALKELEANRWNVITNLIYALADKAYNDHRIEEITMLEEEMRKQHEQRQQTGEDKPDLEELDEEEKIRREYRQ